MGWMWIGGEMERNREEERKGNHNQGILLGGVFSIKVGEKSIVPH